MPVNDAGGVIIRENHNTKHGEFPCGVAFCAGSKDYEKRRHRIDFKAVRFNAEAYLYHPVCFTAHT